MFIFNKIKPLKYLVLFSLLPFSIVHADDVIESVIGPFGTLNNQDNPMSIPSDHAQDLLNVDVAPGGKSVLKRKGYGLAFTLPITTSPTHGLYKFFNSNGNEVMLMFNDAYLSTSINGSSLTTLFSSGTIGATYQCVDFSGFAYCASSSRDPILKITGTSQVPLVTPASGTIIAITPDRLVNSGGISSPNTIYFSKSGDFTSWNAPFSVGTDANQITISAPGSRITHLTYAFGNLIWFKDNSFGYISFGTNLIDWQIGIISPTIGTLDNSSCYREGILYFRGQDCHYYAYDGSNVTKISRDITPTIRTTQPRLQNSWTQTTPSDWNSGSLVNIDSTTNPGSINLSLNSSSTRDSCYGTDSASTQAVCDFGSMVIYRSFTPSTSYKLASITARLSKSASATADFTLELMSDSGGAPNAVLISTSLSNSAIGTSAGDITFTFDSVYGIGSGTRYWIRIRKQCLTDIGNFSWFYPNPDCDSGEYHKLCNNCTVISDGFLKYKANGQAYAASGTFSSAVNHASNLTAWDAFTSIYQNNTGAHTFSVRASTNIFTVTSSTPSWTTITNGAIPTISTGTYFQIRDVMVPGVSSNTPSMDAFTQYWFEGSSADKVYIGYFDSAIWFNVHIGTAAGYNTNVHKFDLINKGWTIYDIPMNGFYVKNDSLYLGSSSGGYVYKYGDIDSDNGSAINAYWKSKDFFGASPFSDTELIRTSVAATSKTGSTLNCYYAINGSTTPSSYSFSLDRSTTAYVRNNRNLPQGIFGSFYNFKFGNNAADQPFEVSAIGIYTRQKSWNVQGQ